MKFGFTNAKIKWSKPLFSSKVPELYRGSSVFAKKNSLIFGNKMLTPGFQTETLPSPYTYRCRKLNSHSSRGIWKKSVAKPDLLNYGNWIRALCCSYLALNAMTFAASDYYTQSASIHDISCQIFWAARCGGNLWREYSSSLWTQSLLVESKTFGTEGSKCINDQCQYYNCSSTSFKYISFLKLFIFFVHLTLCQVIVINLIFKNSLRSTKW